VALALTEGVELAEGLTLDCSLLGGGVVEPLDGEVAELLTRMLFTTVMPGAFCRAICSARSLSAWLETVPVKVIWLLSLRTLMLLLASEASFWIAAWISETCPELEVPVPLTPVFEAEVPVGLVLDGMLCCEDCVVVDWVAVCEVASLLGVAPLVVAALVLPAMLPEVLFWLSVLPLVEVAAPETPPVEAEAPMLALDATDRCSFTFLTPGTELASFFACFLSSLFGTDPSSVTAPSFTEIWTFCRSGFEASCS